MEFTIDITAKEARAFRSIAKEQGTTASDLMYLLIRRFVKEHIDGKYRALFNQMTYTELEKKFGSIESLFPE